MKLKETIALQKLKKQAVVIEQLVILAVSTSPITRADDGMYLNSVFYLKAVDTVGNYSK